MLRKAIALLSAVSVYTAAAVAAPAVTVTFTDTQALAPQCSGGKWTLNLQLQVSVLAVVNGVSMGPQQPMAETGLGTYNMLFYINGQAAPVTVGTTFNAATSTTQAATNAWTFSLQDDQPNIGGSFTLTPPSGIACTTTSAVPTVQAAFTTTTTITGTLPAAFTGVLPTVVNKLLTANQFTGTTVTTPTASGAPTKAPTPAPTTPTVASVTVTFSGGALSAQCSNGKWALFGLNVAVSVLAVVNGQSMGPMQPMAETGLGTYNMLFYINGQAAPVTISSTFNVATPATASGNAWIIQLQDDQPNIGGSFLLTPPSGVACVQGQTAPTIQAAFTTTTPITGTLPAPFTNVLPTVVNALPAANRFTGTSAPTTATTTTNAPTKAPTVATTVTGTPTKAPTTATTTTGGAKVVVTISDGSAFAPQCQNGKWALFGVTMQVTVTATANGITMGPTLPMAETGLGTYNMLWFINGQAAPVTAQGTFNVGNPTTSANAFTFSLLDDQPAIGGSFFLTPTVACTQGQAAPTIQAAFTTTTQITGTLPAAFTVTPFVVNALQTANQFTGAVTV